MECASPLALSVWLVCSLCARSASLTESFTADPRARGWRHVGDTNLFLWNPTNQNLDVTWDSARTNSYLWLPLGTVLSRSDDFTLSFDLRLRDIAIGASANKPYTFQIAVGLLNRTNATATNFFRGAGQSSYGPRNLVEFDYFPDSGYGATFAPTIATTNNVIRFSDNHPLEMTVGDLFHIMLTFTASNRMLNTSITKNGTPFGKPPSNFLHSLALSNNQDFRVDALAVMSYSDAIQVGSPTFWGSVRARGSVDNFQMTLPDPPVVDFIGTRGNAVWRAQFISRTNWSYALERSVNWTAWTTVSPTNAGSGGALSLQDTSAPTGGAFYRVRAMKP